MPDNLRAAAERVVAEALAACCTQRRHCPPERHGYEARLVVEALSAWSPPVAALLGGD